MTKSAIVQTILAAVIMLASRSLLGAPATMPSPPVGYDEWRKTGQFPKTLYLRTGDNAEGAIISTPNPPDDGYRDWPGFTIVDKDDGNTRQLQIHFFERQSFERSTYVDDYYIFNVTKNDIIPLFDQLYLVKIPDEPASLELSRVTDRIPKEIRPQLRTRTICTIADSAKLFWAQHPFLPRRQDYDAIDLRFDKSTAEATLKLYPTFTFRSLNSPLTEAEKYPSRERMELEVKKGKFLTARGRSYKVLNVVPPQDIEDVGHLVGWIELAADPTDVPADDAPAKNSK